MKRIVEDVDHTKRWRVVVILDTGKQVEFTSDWKQTHWEETEHDRTKVLRQAVDAARDIRRKYGVGTTRIEMWEEYRMRERVVETTEKRMLYSTHQIPEEK